MKRLLTFTFVLLFASLAFAESNDSLEVLKHAQAAVQQKLDQFAKNDADYELLLEAQKTSSSLNPRGDRSHLSKLDEECLQLQLKVLLALSKARDSHYDRNSPENAVFMNVAPPLSKGTEPLFSGMDPKAIKDAEVRKAYEDAIAENHLRLEKLKREMALSRGTEYALITIWVFVKRGFPENSEIRKEAITLVEKTITDKTLLERFHSETMPGLTW